MQLLEDEDIVIAAIGEEQSDSFVGNSNIMPPKTKEELAEIKEIVRKIGWFDQLSKCWFSDCEQKNGRSKRRGCWGTERCGTFITRCSKSKRCQ